MESSKWYVEKHEKTYTDEEGKTHHSINYLYPYKAARPKKTSLENVTMVEVEEKPEGLYKYDGKRWVEDTAAISVKESAEAKGKLIKIDNKSIRSIREYIYAVENGDDALKQEALKYIKEEEIEARAEREKIK